MPRAYWGSLVHGRGMPRPYWGSLVHGRGMPRPYWGSLVHGRGMPRPYWGSLVHGRGMPRPNGSLAQRFEQGLPFPSGLGEHLPEGLAPPGMEAFEGTGPGQHLQRFPAKAAAPDHILDRGKRSARAPGRLQQLLRSLAQPLHISQTDS